MSLREIIDNQGGFIGKKASGRLPQVRMGSVPGILGIRRRTFFGSMNPLERDAQHGISLFRIPFLDRDMWFPASSGPEADFDIWLDLADRYHGGYVGGCVGPGDTVLDCGGYAGQFALWSIAAGAERVVVFEPDPRNVECIRRNCCAYVESGRVAIVEAAVSEFSGTTHFHSDSGGSAGTISDSFAAALGKDQAARPSIRVTSIDDSMRDVGLSRVDFIKMDIEGAERDALRGAATTLAQCEPGLAVCTYHLPDDSEVLPCVLGTTSEAYGTRLKRNRYPLIDIWRRRPGR